MINDILKPKSTDEIDDLEKRGFRKNTGKWRFCIVISNILEEYNKNEDLNKFRDSISDTLKEKRNDIFIYVNEDKTKISAYDKVIDSFTKLKKPTVDNLDEALTSLYDWADENDVWIESC